MFIFEDARRRLLRTYNTANKQTLVYDQVEFGEPVPIDTLVPKPNAPGMNTAVSLRMLPGAPLRGETVLYYKRQDLGTAWRHAPLKTLLVVYQSNEQTIHDLLPELNRRLGSNFKPRDIVDGPLESDLGFMELNVIAASGSYEWIGNVKIGVWRKNRPEELAFDYSGKLWLADDIANSTVSGFPVSAKYPIATTSYQYDYSPSAEVLKTFAASPTWVQISDATASALAAALSVNNRWTWAMSASIVPRNLRYAAIYYNGPVKDFVEGIFLASLDPDLSSIRQYLNDDFDNVLIVRPDWPWRSNAGYRSFVIAHYNEPL